MSIDRLCVAIRNFEVNTSTKLRQPTWEYIVSCIEDAGATEELIDLLTDKYVKNYICGTSNMNMTTRQGDSNMKECKFCGAELEYIEYKGLYRCPNHDGFRTVQEVQEYLDMEGFEFEYYIHQMYPNGWQTVCCESIDSNGLFFIDMYGELQEYSTKPHMHTEMARAFIRHCRRHTCETCKYHDPVTGLPRRNVWGGCINQFMKDYRAGGNK